MIFATMFQKYTLQEMKTYWIARCPKCGWKGLSRDCDGFEQIGLTGDYDDGYCPRCGSIIEPDDEVSRTILKWVYRHLTFWTIRKGLKDKKQLKHLIKKIR